MAYMKLEQFLGRGNEKVFWVLSLKDIGGLALGGFVGQQLGSALAGTGIAVILLTLLGAACGLGLMLHYHGLVVGRRLLIQGRYLLRRCTDRVTVTGSMDATADDEPRDADRRHGQIRVRREVDGRPIFGPRRSSFTTPLRAEVSATPTPGATSDADPIGALP